MVSTALTPSFSQVRFVIYFRRFIFRLLCFNLAFQFVFHNKISSFFCFLVFSLHTGIVYRGGVTRRATPPVKYASRFVSEFWVLSFVFLFYYFFLMFCFFYCIKWILSFSFLVIQTQIGSVLFKIELLKLVCIIIPLFWF